MKNNRLVVTLLMATVIMQGILLYRYQIARTPVQRQDPPVQNAPKGTAIETVGLPVEGDLHARVVLVEFADYECPFCARHAATVGADLQREFIANGKIQHVFVNNPLAIHENAKFLATAAICAGAQGAYWQMHERLFAEKPRTKSDVLDLARKLKLDSNEFERCLQSDEPTERIEQDVRKAAELKLTVTPAFGVGRIESRGRVSIQQVIIGAQPIDVFRTAIDAALSSRPAL
jgi:protein-disulfide isomerase